MYAGQTIAGSGSWILPDDVFTFRNFVKVLKEMDSVGVGGDGKGFALTVSSTSEWDWNKSNFSRLLNLGVRLAAHEGLLEKGRNFGSFRAFLDPLVIVIDMKDLLKASSTVGMINFSGPTLYIFPGGNGSSALFGVKGFTGLVDGGYSRRSCSWHFSRHLHQIDMVILSHLGATNFLGMQSFLERKIEAGSPDVGSVFFNCPEKFRKLSPSPESLKVNLFDAGAALSEKLTGVGLQPQPCVTPQPFQPITLYNKVGFGSVDMYVLNPIPNSEEMKSFLHQWSMRAESDSFSAHSGVPLSNTLSVSVLLVWKPFSPSAKIIRILFPGGTPQGKIFEGLDRLKNIPVFERSECSQTELFAKPTRVAQGRPTTLKPTAAKTNGNVDHKETAKAKAMNGSRDSLGGKAKAEAREPVLVKASATTRATKVEAKKPETRPVNGTATPKADSKSTTKPPSPSKDAKATSTRNVESLPPKRLAQKPSEAEASPKNKATKASQPEAVKQAKPARRTEELKTAETVKQTTASKQSNVAKEPAAKQLNIVKDSKAARHSEPLKQAKTSSAPETAKPGTPKPAKVLKESEKKGIKQAEPKKPKLPESEKKDLEKEVKEEVAPIQPAEDTKRSKTSGYENVCVAAVEQTSELPPEVGLNIADTVLSDVEAATRAADYDLPSPEDVAQMSQEDEDSFVEELPTEVEPGYGDQKEKESGVGHTADPDLIVNHELRDDVVANVRDVQVVRDLDRNGERFGNENGVERNEDLAHSHEIPENVVDAEIVEDQLDAELEEDLEFERDEEAVKNLDDSVEDAIVAQDEELAQLSHVQDPDLVPDHDVSGVGELVSGVDDGKEKEHHEDLIDQEDLVHRAAAAVQCSVHDQDVLEEPIIAEGNNIEKEDKEKDHDLEDHRDFERELCLEKEQVEKDLPEDHDFQKNHDLEKRESPNSWLLQDSRSMEEGAFQVKRATDGFARYCEEYGSDEGEAAAEDEEQHAGDELKEHHVTCPGGIQVPARKVDDEEEEEEDDASELEAVEEEDELEEDEAARYGVERRTVPEIGCEVDVVSNDVDVGSDLPDVLGVGKEDAKLVGSLEAEAGERSSSPVSKVQADVDEELVADEGFGRSDDFDKDGDFGVNSQDFGKGGEDFGRAAEEGFGRGDDFEKDGDFRRREDDLCNDEDVLNDEEAGKAEEEVITGMEGKDGQVDDASDIDVSENKEGLIAGEGSGGSISDNEAEETEPGVTKHLESTDDCLPCVLKKDTAIENLAAICAETKEERSGDVFDLSSREPTVGEARPDLVAACEAALDAEAAIETEDEDRAKLDDRDVEEVEKTDGYASRFETEEQQNLSLDDGISQGVPHDLHLFKAEEEQPSSSSWKLDDLAANLAHDVIRSSLAAQSLDSSACFASGPVSVAPLNGTEHPEVEGHESTPETLQDVTNLVNTMVDTVATSDGTPSGRFNYGFDDYRREDAFAVNPFDGASAVVEPLLKSGEDSGESDLDEGQDACHQGQHGLLLGNEPEDVSRLDEGFEESTGDESPANVTELLSLRVENTVSKSPLSAEDNEGRRAFAYGASGEFEEEEEEAFGSGGGPASEKTADNSGPLLEFDSDVSATHQMDFGNGCVEAHHRDEMDAAWQRQNLNPFLDPCSVEAEEGGNVDRDLIGNDNAKLSGEAGYFESMNTFGVHSEDFDRKLEDDEQSIPSDDNAESVLPPSHEQDMVDDRSGVDPKETPKDEAAKISACVEEHSLEANELKSQAVEETSEKQRTSSFWTCDDNVQATESGTVRGAADNILFSEETTTDGERDINENLGIATGPEEEEEEDELAEDLEKVSTQSNASEEEGESRSSAVLSEPHEGAESLDSDGEVDPVKSWGQPMGLPAPARDSNQSRLRTGARPNNDAANLTLPVSTHDKKPPAKSNDRSFVAPQKKAGDVRKSGALKTAADLNESRENGSVAKTTTIAKKPVTSSAAPVAKKQTASSTDAPKSKPLKHVVPFYVDLTYIPGNGDPAYVDTDFFRRVRARYYVLSSLEPDPRVLSCLVEGKQTWENKDLSVNVIPTHDSSALHRWFHDNAKLVEELKISLLPAANKCTIKLQDKDDGCYAFRIEF